MLSDQVRAPTGNPDDELVAEILAKRKSSQSHLSDWVTDAKRWYGMVAGDQWDEADKVVLKEQNKPPVAFNRIAININAICGFEANNRQEVQYLPRQLPPPPGAPPQPGPAGGIDLLTAAAIWARDLCDAEDEESDAFRDTVICGYGWTETKMDYDEHPEGQIVISRRDPTNFNYDPAAIKRNLSDARWISCDDYLADETILARWPDAEIAPTTEGRPDSESPHDATRAPWYEKSATQNAKDGLRLVIHHCWKELVPYLVVQSTGPDGMPIVENMSEEDYEIAQERSTAMGMPLMGKRRTKTVYKHAYILGEQLLESGDAPCQYEFVYKCITGYRDRNKGTFHGIVLLVEDPQRYANKMLSQTLHMINTNAKGGLVAEVGAVADVRKFEDDWAKTDSVVWVNAGAISGGKIMPKPIPAYPASISEIMTFAVTSIRDGCGVNLEMLGLADRTQAGVLEEQRTSAGITTIATLFDSLRQYRKQQGRLLAHFICEYISDGRLIRVSGPLGEEFVPWLRQKDVMDYDVIVDDAPTSRDMKAKTFQALTQIVPMVLQNGGPVPEEALDYAPLPAQLTKSWKQQIAAKKQQPPQPTPEVQVAMAVQATEQAKVQLATIKGQTDQAIEGIKLQIKQEELALLKQQHEMKLAEHAMKMELERQKMQNEQIQNRLELADRIISANQPQPVQ